MAYITMSMKQYLYRLWQWLYKGIPVMKVNAGVTTIFPSHQLQGRKILITGGSQGIGLQIAKRFVAEGAEVLIVGRDARKLKDAAQNIGCKYVAFDLTNIAELPNLIQKTVELLGGLDGLVNNAGVCNIDKGFLNVTEQSYDEQFLLNVKSPFFLTQAFVDCMIQHEVLSSAVLFVTSERGLYPDDAPYGMTKAAIGSIISGIARRFAIHGVHCNGIAPGVTADLQKNPEKMDDLYLKCAVGKRYIMPQELAEVATFLMSDSSKCISGEIIPCNQANHYK